jgi:hypothetical protein
VTPLKRHKGAASHFVLRNEVRATAASQLAGLHLAPSKKNPATLDQVADLLKRIEGTNADDARKARNCLPMTDLSR